MLFESHSTQGWQEERKAFLHVHVQVLQDFNMLLRSILCGENLSILSRDFWELKGFNILDIISTRTTQGDILETKEYQALNKKLRL